MKYYVNKRAQSNGDHEVHNENCRYLPSAADQKYLGNFTNCQDAVKEAKKTIRPLMGVQPAHQVAIRAKLFSSERLRFKLVKLSLINFL